MRVVHDTIGIPITGACHLLNLSRNEIRTHRSRNDIRHWAHGFLTELEREPTALSHFEVAPSAR